MNTSLDRPAPRADGDAAQRPLAELLASLAGFVAVQRTGKVTHAFLIGMPVLWGLTAVAVG